MKIAIIGAGLAGLHLASQISSAHTVTVYEKARGPGGRMSTRRAAPYAFDHGAQYFTAESEAFRDFLNPLIADGAVAEWPETIELRAGAYVSEKLKYAPISGMNTICKALADNLDVGAGVEVTALHRRPEGWHLSLLSGEVAGPYDWVVSTAPAPQTALLFPDTFAHMSRLSAVKMRGCFALMLGFEEPLRLDWVALKSAQPPIGWIAVNSAKPGRSDRYSVIVQSSNDWAESHLDDDADAITQTLLLAASELAQTDLSCARHQALHRWRYASTQTPAGAAYLKDDDLQLAACGDWCTGGKVEAAFLSANALAEPFRS